MPGSQDAPIDFYIDFSSPYGYLAGHGIDEIAEKHGREVMWRPFLLGVVFAITGQSPLTSQPMRGAYALHDFQRSARAINIPFVMPDPFPVLPLAAGRAYYWLHDRDPDMAKRFAKSVYHRMFGEGGDISKPAAIVAIAEACGADGAELADALTDPAIKERLKAETQAAIDRGVFGSPFTIVDGEPFWGADRLEQVDKWLGCGGW